jgi:hypothetical protein
MGRGRLPRSLQPLRGDEVLALLHQLENGDLGGFSRLNTKIQKAFLLVESAVAAGATATPGPPDKVLLNFKSDSSVHFASKLVVSVVQAVTHGISLVTGLLNSSSSSSSSSTTTSSSSSSSSSSSRCAELLAHQSALHCVATCCGALAVLVRQQSSANGGDRRSIVELALLLRTTGVSSLRIVCRVDEHLQYVRYGTADMSGVALL